MTTRKPLLSDHKKVGKKFLPPAALLGMTEIHYIERILPEIVWVGYFIRRFGGKKGSEMAILLIETCFFLKNWGVLPEFALLSNYRALSLQDWQAVREKLHEKNAFAEVVEALAPFVRCYPENNPFISLLSDDSESAPSSTEIDVAREVIACLFNRRSQTASIAQSVVLRADLRLGKYHVPDGFPFHNVDALVDDFESEFAQEASAHVRMHVNSTYGFYESRIGETWASYFWNRGKNLVPLRAGNEIPEIPEEAKLHPMIRLGLDYQRYAWAVVDEIWSKFPVNVYESEFAEVIGALLARQCNLAVKLARNPELWDYHAGPLFLRPMTDCYITLAWIMINPLDHARKFIIYGLGQEKLEIERFKSMLDEQSSEDRKRMEQVIRVREAWLNSQHYSFLQHVDIGSWSGISTRKMAEEADCLDLYNFSYTGWSHAAHGTWNHIGKFDALPSPEPLHKHIWQPAAMDHGAQIDVVEQATKYFDKMCVLLVEKFQLPMEAVPPVDWLEERLERLFAEVDTFDDSDRE